MIRIDLLNYSEFGKVSDLESLLTNNPVDKISLSKAIFKCIDAKDFTQDHIKSIKLLISHGADLSQKDQKFQSYLMLACMKGNLDLVKTLLAYGADPKELDRQQRTPIILSLTNPLSDPLEIVKLLHEKEASIAAKDMSGMTALHFAAQNGHRDSLEYLVSQKVDVNAQDTNFDTPLHLAFRRDRRSCIDFLIQYADKDLKNFQGKSPLDEAHGKGLAYVNSKKFVKEEPWDSRKPRGKQRGKNYKKRERDGGECFKCKKFTDVYCLECASEIIQTPEAEAENAEKRSLFEAEECLRIAKIRVKELEKENEEIRGSLLEQSSNYSIKVKKSPLYLRNYKEKAYEQLKEQLRGDIESFARDQERWRGKIDQSYNEAINIFRGVITDTFQNVTIEIFGSFATGLLLPYSDIDLVIMGVTSPTLNALKELIPRIDSLSIVKKSDKIFSAAIPLLKVYTEIRQQEVKLDVTIQEPKHRGLECTVLVKKFLGSYKTLKYTFLVLKQLMYFSNFHEPYKGGISYGLFLMLIYFFQENANTWDIINAEKEKNEAEVLIKFLEFYLTVFTYNKYVVVDYEGWDNKELKNKVVRNI